MEVIKFNIIADHRKSLIVPKITGLSGLHSQKQSKDKSLKTNKDSESKRALLKSNNESHSIAAGKFYLFNLVLEESKGETTHQEVVSILEIPESEMPDPKSSKSENIGIDENESEGQQSNVEKLSNEAGLQKIITNK